MGDRELKRLSRADLLELLTEQMEENERLRRELEETRALLSERRILIDQAGSIAEAAMELNGVFQAAQKAADLYLENVRRMAQKTEREQT